MLKHALAVLVIGAASATSVAANADWNGAARYAPPPHVVAPHYCPPNRWAAPTAYHWAPAPYYAPYRYAPYRYAPPYGYSNHGWRKVWRQDRFDHGPNHGWNGPDHGNDRGDWHNH